MFVDRGSPLFKGERRRPAGGMNATGWRKMCRDVRLFKDLAKASIIFEEVTRGLRAMDFDLFQAGLACAAERKQVGIREMEGFIQHYAASFSGGGGDDSSVNSMGSGGSLNSMGSLGSLGNLSSMSRVKQGGVRNRRKKKKGKRSTREYASLGTSNTTSGDESVENKLIGLVQHQSYASVMHGVATTSILEETKHSDSREDMGFHQKLHNDNHTQTKGPSLKSFAAASDAKGDYARHIALTLEALNTSLLNREELSDCELEATGFSWEVKERLNTKILEGASIFAYYLFTPDPSHDTLPIPPFFSPVSFPNTYKH